MIFLDGFDMVADLTAIGSAQANDSPCLTVINECLKMSVSMVNTIINPDKG